MVVHLFNSSVVSGPEMLVLPALTQAPFPACVIFLTEERRGEAGRAPPRHARRLGLAVAEVVVRSRFDGAALRELARLLDAAEPRIVHAHDVKASTYLLAASRLGHARPALFSTHHGIHGRPDARSRLYEQLYSRVVLRGFHRVLCVSRADERELRARGLTRVHLHPNGIDAPLLHPAVRPLAARRIRRAWGLAADDPTPLIGVVGRLSREKRHDRVLRTLAALSPSLPWQLVCFGGGALQGELRRLADALHIGHRVHWMGYRSEVGRELGGLDLLISLSDAEGLPINLIEAGCAATPVFATAVGGVIDLLGDPPAGALVSPRLSPAQLAAPLAALLVDGETRARLGQALQARVAQHFSRRAWLERLHQLYAPFLAPPLADPSERSGSPGPRPASSIHTR